MTHEMPKHLPELPEGYVYLGKGRDLRGAKPDRYLWCWLDSQWVGPPHDREMFVGWERDRHYAAPIDSDLGRKILAERGKPSWDSAPDWAEWLAQDASGDWCWYQKKPVIQEWDTDGEYAYIDTPSNPNRRWRETLERRPESELADIQRGMNEALHKIEQEGHGTKQGDTDTKSDAVRRAIDRDILIPPKIIPGDGTSGNPLRPEEVPDLIIPSDVTRNLTDLASRCRKAGYRIEWDSNGIRGWKES